jgi:4-aminobutyrate aminotransferase
MVGANHLNKGVARITDGIMVKGEGSYVKYDDGRKYLDFTCGIGVTNLGMSLSISALVLP